MKTNIHNCNLLQGQNGIVLEHCWYLGVCNDLNSATQLVCDPTWQINETPQHSASNRPKATTGTLKLGLIVYC